MRDRLGGWKDGKLEYNKVYIMKNILINVYWILIVY